MKEKLFLKSALICFLAAESILYAIFLSLDLLGHSDKTYYFRYFGILLCLVFALLCAFRGGDRLTAPAMALTAAADWFLLLRDDHLTLGVALFLGVQALYAFRIYRSGKGCGLRLRLCLALIFISILLFLKLASPLNMLAVFYFSQLVSNTILAWQIPSLRLFASGLTLFIGCDICVGLFNTVALSSAVFPFVSIGMWFFYLPSQVFIVLSSMPQKELTV